MYERRTDELLARGAFLRRLARNAGIGAGLLLVSLGIGMLGYHFIEGLPWVDAYLNSAMLMGGMGPVDAPKSAPGKLFAGTYALYCGLVLLIVAGVSLAPVVHRFLHKFHLARDKR
jgi:hypothetical protein